MTPGFHFPSEPLWLFPYHSPFLTSALLLQSSPVTHYYNLALIGTECDVLHTSSQGFAGDSVVLKKKKNPLANAGDTDSIPELERSLRERNGNPFQYSCLGNPMDRGAWRAMVHGVAKSQIRLSD